MHAHANQRDADRDLSDDADREEILATVASLRHDVSSMASEIREVLRENAELKEKLSRAKGSRSGEQWISEAQRIQREVDQLVRLHEAASAARPRRRPAPRRDAAEREGRGESQAWMKKMMMFMMLADMV